MNDQRPIHEILGLKPWSVFEAEARAWHEEIRPMVGTVDPTRRTGRTTRMLVAALEYVRLTGLPVVIVGACPGYTKRLLRNVREMARKCELDPRMFQAEHPSALRFVDHAVLEAAA